MRRSTGNSSPVLTCGPVAADSSASQVTVDNGPVKLTAHDYKLLAYLMHHKGRVLSRTELIEHIYAQDFDNDYQYRPVPPITALIRPMIKFTVTRMRILLRLAPAVGMSPAVSAARNRLYGPNHKCR